MYAQCPKVSHKRRRCADVITTKRKRSCAAHLYLLPGAASCVHEILYKRPNKQPTNRGATNQPPAIQQIISPAVFKQISLSGMRKVMKQNYWRACSKLATIQEECIADKNMLNLLAAHACIHAQAAAHDVKNTDKQSTEHLPKRKRCVHNKSTLDFQSPGNKRRTLGIRKNTTPFVKDVAGVPQRSSRNKTPLQARNTPLEISTIAHPAMVLTISKHCAQETTLFKLLREMLTVHFDVRPIASKKQLLSFLTTRSHRLKLLPKLIQSLKLLLTDYNTTSKTYSGSAVKHAISYESGLYKLLHVCATTCAHLKTIYLERLRQRKSPEHAAENAEPKVEDKLGLDKQVNSILSHLH